MFVSAENSQFQNYFAGPQVIQVIVSDPDINRLDQAYGEPAVTVNGKKLRMTQATVILTQLGCSDTNEYRFM